MPSRCIIGLQWGDEGKGKVVDALAAESDYVVRYQGGGNAGHTVIVEEEKFVLHHIPSGILQPGPTCIVGGGVVVDPTTFLLEIEGLKARGIDCRGRLLLSDRAHLVLPYHRALDAVEDRGEGNLPRIGTTGRGIGPCYADKYARRGVRVCDLLHPAQLQRRVRAILEEKNRILTRVYDAEPLPVEATMDELVSQAQRIAPFAGDPLPILESARREDKNILFEGAQGAMLHVDFGTYPYVTSSHSDATGIPAGAGVPPSSLGAIVGVMKAYTTRVGEGPFPTEDKGPMGDRLREQGREFGATTGRPRRCGWLDMVALRHACRVSGVQALALTKLDVLDGVEEIRVAVAYEREGRPVTDFPADLDVLAACTPRFETLPGWSEKTSEAREFDDLPTAVKTYICFIENCLHIPVQIVSVGPRRKALIQRTST